MTTKLTFKNLLSAGFIAAIASVTINVLLFLIFSAAGVFTDEIEIQPGQALSILPIIISSIMPTLLAILEFYLIDKYTKNGFTIFTIISVVLLVLSFLNPFMMIPNVTLAYAVVLNVMHVVVAGMLLYFIKRAYQKQA
jgi:hypothetical protein